MQKLLMVGALGVLALASCNRAAVVGSAKTYAFANMGLASYSKAAGTATVTQFSTNDTGTVLIASGLLPSTAYVAHYHAVGTASTDPCRSAGPIVDGMIGGEAVQSDAGGTLTLKGLDTTSALSSAKYINIHEAASLATVPLCADLSKSPVKQ
ncbi:hypothetical protein [Deinococcus sonorensis]|uniref:Superoxide dismutase n=2 Tax=Deinococcus sonorensis TaxID=309891 RepID=A0AAU7UF04_9DEIO